MLAIPPCCAIGSPGNGCPWPVPLPTNPIAATLTSSSSLRPGAYNDETLIQFLTDVHDLQRRRVLLIWGGLPSHRSRRMLAWIASQHHWLHIEPLPGYAPELNPIEQVWSNLKSSELANLCCDRIGDVASIADEGLDRIGSDAALCFAFLRHSGLRL